MLTLGLGWGSFYVGFESTVGAIFQSIWACDYMRMFFLLYWLRFWVTGTQNFKMPSKIEKPTFENSMHYFEIY